MSSSLFKVLTSVTRVIAIIFSVAIVVLAYQGKMSIEQFGAYALLVLNHFFLTSAKQAESTPPVDKSIIVNP